MTSFTRFLRVMGSCSSTEKTNRLSARGLYGHPQLGRIAILKAWRHPPRSIFRKEWKQVDMHFPTPIFNLIGEYATPRRKRNKYILVVVDLRELFRYRCINWRVTPQHYQEELLLRSTPLKVNYRIYKKSAMSEHAPGEAFRASHQSLREHLSLSGLRPCHCILVSYYQVCRLAKTLC